MHAYVGHVWGIVCLVKWVVILHLLTTKQVVVNKINKTHTVPMPMHKKPQTQVVVWFNFNLI